MITSNPLIRNHFRSPREGEKDGVAYNFVSKVAMEAAIDNDEFIEFATFAGNMYGTSKAAVKTVMDKGLIILLQSLGLKNIARRINEENFCVIFIRSATNAEFD